MPRHDEHCAGVVGLVVRATSVTQRTRGSDPPVWHFEFCRHSGGRPNSPNGEVLVANCQMDTDKIKIYGARVKADDNICRLQGANVSGEGEIGKAQWSKNC